MLLIVSKVSNPTLNGHTSVESIGLHSHVRIEKYLERANYESGVIFKSASPPRL